MGHAARRSRAVAAEAGMPNFAIVMVEFLE